MKAFYEECLYGHSNTLVIFLGSDGLRIGEIWGDVNGNASVRSRLGLSQASGKNNSLDFSVVDNWLKGAVWRTPHVDVYGKYSTL